MSQTQSYMTTNEAEDDAVEWADDLDKDEISDLLGFDLASEVGEDRSGLKALINSALVSHRRLPMLDVVFDRAARLMTTDLRHLTNENVDVTLDDISSTRFGDFVQSVSEPSVVAVLKSSELENYCLLTLDGSLVYGIVDFLLGGRRGASVADDERGFTAIELALTGRVCAALATGLGNAFEPVRDINFSVDRLETTARFAAIAQDASVCSLAKFRVELEGQTGSATILTPHAALEPIFKLLQREFIGETGGNEAVWRAHLTDEVAESDVDVDFVLAEKFLTLSEVLALSPGQTLSFAKAVNAPAELRVGDQTIAYGKIGKAGAQIAVRVTTANDTDGEAT
ncbi:MAG: FliM/FliN family flagellar motor switch protein [Pseudomonadota bacterium]